MKDDAFAGVVYNLAQDAAFHIDHDIAPSRELATRYYRAAPLGDEEENRSDAVLSTIRDTVNSVLPSLLRVFGGSQTAVEFVPRSEAEVGMAAEATDAINDLFWNKNHGFSQVLDPAFQDALVRKTGVLYWWFEERERVRDFVYKGLTEDEMDMLLAQDDAMEVVSKELCTHGTYAKGREADPRNPDTDPVIMDAIEAALEAEMGVDVDLEVLPEPDKYDFRVRRRTVDPMVRVECLPPEQYIISRSATSEGNAICQGRRQVVTVSDLVAIGFDFDEVVEHRGTTPYGSVSATNNEQVTRDPALAWGRTEAAGDDALSPVLYHELFVKVDRDGDGIAELWRVQTIGEQHHILHAEIYEEDEAPFALLCPFPEPHRAIGSSLADRLIDLQEINSRVWRATLDSLTASIFPRTVVMEGQVNLDDVLNTEPGAIIRARSLGAVQEFAHTFQGQQAMGVIAQLDQIKAERTGISAASQGLDPEVLQSTTAAAVSATTSAADATQEMIARRFAETGLKRMFAGLLRLVCRHVEEPLDITRRDGTLGKVDPRNWNADLLTQVNVGLGKGRDQDRLQVLMQMLQWQQMIVQATGPNGPVGPQEIRNTIEAISTIGGVKDVSKFVKPIPPGWTPPNPAEQPNPQLELARGQVQADIAKAQIEARKVELDHEREILRMRIEDEFRRDQMAQDRVLKLAELEARYASTLDQKQMDQQIDLEKTRIGHVADLHKSYAANTHASEQAALDRVQAMEMRGLDQHHAHDTAEITAASAPKTPPAQPGAPV